MRISRLRCLALTGMLGLAGVCAASAAGKSCPETYGSRAVQLAECNGGFADRQRLAQVYSQELGLTAETASRLADALAARQTLLKRHGRDDPELEQEIRRIESDFIFLLNQAPDNLRIAAEVSWFYSDGNWRARVPSSILLDLVARSADPIQLAARLTEHGTSSRASLEILLAALAVNPKPAVLWRQAAQQAQDHPAWKIALLEEAYRRLTEGAVDGPVDSGIATALAGELLHTQLDAGLAPQAIATLRSLPPAIRSRIEEGSIGEVKTEVGGLFLWVQPRDLRRPLVAAYLLSGDPQAAAGLIARIAPATATEEDPEEQGGEASRRILLRWLQPSPDDPFDLLIASLSSTVLVRPEESIDLLMLARLAERESYPAVAAHCLDALDYASADDAFAPSRGVPARVRASVEALRGEIEKLHQSLADEARADREAARTALGPDPAAATVSRLLRSPATVRFAEKPLPEGIAPVELTDKEVEKRQKQMVKGMRLPAGFGLIRAERQGDRAVAIGVSQAYDPVGEISSGAYWVLLSSDGGRTWDPPLYTGLRVNQPYVVRAVSGLPLLAGDRLQIEVEIAELDPSRIVFPPIMLAPRRTAKGLYLDVPLDLLQKDSDGDGLTDLAEERLMTDPESRDTDGDGLEDGVDPMPQVPFQREAPSSARTRALAAFLAETWGADRAALIEGIAAGPNPLCCVKDKVRPVDEKTLFLTADRALFSTLAPKMRVVVLAPEEVKAAREKFGPFYPQKLEIFFFDRSGRRAYVIWNASWQGGQTLLEERPDGTWKATSRGGWIT